MILLILMTLAIVVCFILDKTLDTDLTRPALIIIMTCLACCLLITGNLTSLSFYSETSTELQTERYSLVAIQPNTDTPYFETSGDNLSSLRFGIELENGSYQLITINSENSKAIVSPLKDGQRPYVEIKTAVTGKRAIRKPNVYINPVGAFVELFSDYDVGDFVNPDEVTKETTYTYYIPQTDKETVIK